MVKKKLHKKFKAQSGRPHKMVRPDDRRRSQAWRRRAWIETFVSEDMGAVDGTITTGEYELVQQAADIAVGPKDHKMTAEDRRELREIIGTLRRGRGKRA